MAGAAPLRLLVRGPEGSVQESTFGTDVVRVGRAAESDLAIESTFVSRLHARFERGPTGWEVVDEGSKNGVYLNGQRLEGRAPVRSGDTVRVGDFSLLLAEDPPPPPPPPAPEPLRPVVAPMAPAEERTALNPQRNLGGLTPDRGVPPVVRVVPPAPEITSIAPTEQRIITPPVAQPTVAQPAVGGAEASAPPTPLVTAGAGAHAQPLNALSAREQSLFTAFAAATGELAPVDLISAVWGAGEGDEEMLERLVLRLNHKLQPGSGRVERTRDGGYRLDR